MKNTKDIAKTKAARIAAGFGRYPQTAECTVAPIEWRVLEVRDGKALLISRYGLDSKTFYYDFLDKTWDVSTLREWLNGEFLEKAFTAAERKKILTTTVVAEKNPDYNTPTGADTEDKLFLLSISEAEKYFRNDNDRICKGTKYAYRNGAILSGDAGWWWLRTCASERYNASFVSACGCVITMGDYVVSGGSLVRPAMWIDLNA